ncbi:hypothetical protein NMY22_g7812 [Coprinellus aureogranulatus]|nr:hypothetical protein NMY22_g7812 [Coprinellus aureogranulatus]
MVVTTRRGAMKAPVGKGDPLGEDPSRIGGLQNGNGGGNGNRCDSSDSVSSTLGSADIVHPARQDSLTEDDTRGSANDDALTSTTITSPSSTISPPSTPIRSQGKRDVAVATRTGASEVKPPSTNYQGPTTRSKRNAPATPVQEPPLLTRSKASRPKNSKDAKAPTTLRRSPRKNAQSATSSQLDSTEVDEFAGTSGKRKRGSGTRAANRAAMKKVKTNVDEDVKEEDEEDTNSSLPHASPVVDDVPATPNTATDVEAANTPATSITTPQKAGGANPHTTKAKDDFHDSSHVELPSTSPVPSPNANAAPSERRPLPECYLAMLERDRAEQSARNVVRKRDEEDYRQWYNHMQPMSTRPEIPQGFQGLYDIGFLEFTVLHPKWAGDWNHFIQKSHDLFENNASGLPPVVDAARAWKAFPTTFAPWYQPEKTPKEVYEETLGALTDNILHYHRGQLRQAIADFNGMYACQVGLPATPVESGSQAGTSVAEEYKETSVAAPTSAPEPAVSQANGATTFRVRFQDIGMTTRTRRYLPGFGQAGVTATPVRRNAPRRAAGST